MIERILGAIFPVRVRQADPVIQAGRLAASLMPGRPALDVLRAVHLARILGAGETGLDILPMRMEASAMGPMNKRLHDDLRHVVRMTAAGRPLSTVWERDLDMVVSDRVRRACELLAPLTSAQISAFMQRDGSAWSLSWVPDAFSTRPISDPTRWNLHRRSAWRGAPIGLTAMRQDHSTMHAGGERKAA